VTPAKIRVRNWRDRAKQRKIYLLSRQIKKLAKAINKQQSEIIRLTKETI